MDELKWTAWKLVAVDGKATGSKTNYFQNYMICVGMKKSTKRRRYRIAIDNRTSLATRSKDANEMDQRHPGLLVEIEQTLLDVELSSSSSR